MLSDTDARALGDALRSEYAAIFGYGVVSAYISGARNSSIAEVWSAHRSRRNRIIHLIESAGEKAPLPEVAYTSQDKVWDNLTAIQLAAHIEDDCSVAWSRALQQCTTPESRKLAMQALLHTAEWNARWRMAAGMSPAIDPLPGLRRLDDKHVKEVDPGDAPSPTTPGAGTIDELVSCLQQAGHGEIAADQTLKTLMVKTREPGGEWVPLGIGIPGDRELDQKRLEAAFDPTEVELFEAEDFEKYPFIKKGYIGPLELLDNDIAYCVDPRAAAGTAWVVGGGRPDVHRLHAVVGRDFTPTGVLDVATIREGDPAPDGHGTLTLARGIEIGHIFQLGRKYTNAFELDVLGEDGKPQRVTMGSYGIGVSRLVAVLAEQFHDEKGLRWPAQVAPWDVHVVVANKAEGVAEAAAGIAEQLSAAGLEVLLDDRKASPGVKFKDSELLGMPRVLVIGRGWANGKVELRNRLTGESEEMEPVAALDALTAR